MTERQRIGDVPTVGVVGRVFVVLLKTKPDVLRVVTKDRVCWSRASATPLDPSLPPSSVEILLIWNGLAIAIQRISPSKPQQHGSSLSCC